MNRLARLRLSFKRSEWRAQDRLFGRIGHRQRPQVEHNAMVPAARRRRSRKSSHAVQEGQAIVLVFFLLVVVLLGMMLSPRSPC